MSAPLANASSTPVTPLELGRLALKGRGLVTAPRGSAPVVVLPGFRADDLSTFPLRSFLRGLGHEVEGWGLGRNGGHVQSLLPKVARRVRALHESGGRPVHLIGQSLGGVLAREIARDHPAAVAQVLTLGTPVVGGPAYTALHRRYPA